jgi:hypothetical protein
MHSLKDLSFLLFQGYELSYLKCKSVIYFAELISGSSNQDVQHESTVKGLHKHNRPFHKFYELDVSPKLPLLKELCLTTSDVNKNAELACDLLGSKTPVLHCKLGIWSAL